MTNIELNFPRISLPGGHTAYGGNQDWFPTEWARKAGCGSTSGANLAAYYAARFPAMRALYRGDAAAFSQPEYVACMEELYGYMTPGIMGFPYAGRFARRFVEFAADHGVTLRAGGCGCLRSAEQAIAFVQNALQDGHPLALLILHHRAPELREDNWHWVTITGCIEQVGRPAIVVSNCGEREVYLAERLFEVHPANVIRLVRFYHE